MKLQELAVLPQTKQITKVFESYFGNSITFESISKRQAHAMLGKVRGLISEHRSTPAYHGSEKSPAYMKLVMLEQVLSKKIREEFPATAGGGVVTTAGAPNANQQAVAKAQATNANKQKINQVQDPAVKAVIDKANNGQGLTPDEQKMMANIALGTNESRRKAGRRLSESEVQQAQVILASQDMVDQVQKMIEQVTSLQFKDLPALVDQIRNEIGYEQATQFSAEATAALGSMVQNLQGSKIQLEGAMGTVTGQAPVIPGAADVAAELPADEPAADLGDLDAVANDELDVDVDVDVDEPVKTGLGRERR